MKTPLSLRICCIAAMAPALTDATGQAKISISDSSVNFSNTQLYNGDKRDLSSNDKAVKKSIIKRFNFGLDRNLSEALHHEVNVKRCHVINKSSIHCLMPKPLQNFARSSFQQEFLKSIDILDRMNQPSPRNGNEKSGDFENSTESVNDKPVNINGKKKINSINLKLTDQLSKNTVTMPPEVCETNTTSTEDNNGTDKDKLNDCDANLEATLKCEETSASEDTIVKSTMPKVSSSEKLRAIVESCSLMDIRLEASKNLAQSERRMEFYLRRLRRLQGRDIEDHVKNQISLCLEHQQKNLHSITKRLSQDDSLNYKTGSELDSSVLNKNLSTAALVNLVQQAQKQASYQDPLDEKVHETTFSLNIDKRTRKETQKVSDLFLRNCHHVEKVVDSDATESSSGGESADEYDLVAPTPHKKIHKTLNKYADWKWSSERAALASRWTWLQAQVSDLEYRIRQQTDICKQIRQNKGSIVLGDPPSTSEILTTLIPGSVSQTTINGQSTTASPCNISTVLSNVDKQANKLTQSLGVLTPRPSPLNSEKSCSSSPNPLNGLTESPYSTDMECVNNNSQTVDQARSSSSSETIVNDGSCQAARCRPLRSYRKRKLLSTLGLYQTSHKASRYSTVDCQCYHPVTPCSMCGGRYNNKQSFDADRIPQHECASHLDSSFHPVLSFPNDIPLSLKFDSLLKTGDWVSNRQKKSQSAKTYPKKKYQRSNNLNDRRKICKNAAAIIQSAKIRNKYENNTIKRDQKSVLRRTIKKKYNTGLGLKRRQAAKAALVAARRLSSSENYGGGRHSKDNSLLKELRAENLRKKRAESAYDINNIVIPYSIAASTRVEKLKYKEIATPEWRDLSIDPVEETEQIPDTEIEDLSDEAFLVRHQKCEAEERKRFASFIQYPMRRRLKTDSGGLIQESENSIPFGDSQINPDSVGFMYRQSVSRRDTLSTGSSFDDSRDTNDQREHVEPWIPRAFPLSEQEYDEMEAVQPHVYETQTVQSSLSVFKSSRVSSSRTNSIASSSRPTSPSPSTSNSTESVSGDDPNDPEWMDESSTQVIDN